MRTVEVVSVVKSDMPECFFDSSPDFFHIKLKGVNCTIEEFTDWFKYTSVSSSGLICTQTGIIDLDCNPKTKVGDTFSVTFEEWLPAYVGYCHKRIANISITN